MFFTNKKPNLFRQPVNSQLNISAQQQMVEGQHCLTLFFIEPKKSMAPSRFMSDILLKGLQTIYEELHFCSIKTVTFKNMTKIGVTNQCLLGHLFITCLQ